MFDGFSEDWVITNNLVVQDHPHGISLYGAKNCKIVNNTVIRNPLELFYNGSDPWVRINKHKDNRFSTGNLVRNNISGAFIMDAIPGSDDHNTVSTNYTNIFVDYDNWDFHLKENAAEIDAGFIDDSPQTDFEGLVRLPSNTPDRGCLEKEATIFDITAPSAPTNVHTLNVDESSVIITWDAASDNTGIAHYKVYFDGKTIKTSDTEAHIYRLSPATAYEFSIEAVDYAKNTSPPTVFEITTADLPAGDFYTLKIPIHSDDHQIRSSNKLEWVGLYENKVGGVSDTYDASLVLPFQLPQLGDLEVLESAELKLNLKAIHNSPANDINLYGLPYRTLSDVLSDDNWQGSYGDDANSTAIAQNYISSSSNIGTVPMNTSATTAMAAYINSQYDAGATAGKYAFLRLNSSTANEASNTYFTVGSANEPQSKDRPYLALTIRKAPSSIYDVENTSELTVYPNPISTKQILKIEIPTITKEGRNLLLIHDIMGRLVYEKNLKNISSPIFNLDMRLLNLTSGTYQLIIKGEITITQTRLLIIH